MPHVSIAQALAAHIPLHSLQTILFNRSEWTVRTARSWLIKHHLKHDDWRKTANEIRFWQKPDIKHAKYYSKHIGDGSIIFVFQSYE